MVCSNAPNDQQGLEEQLASTSLTVALVGFVRPGWLFETSKTTPAWWLASNLRSMPLDTKCQINNQHSRQSVSHLPTESWIALEKLTTGGYLQLRSFTLLLLDHGSCHKAPKLRFLRSRLCCRMVCSNAPNDQLGLEELFWQLASTTPTMAPVSFKTRKTAAAWWLASNWRSIQLRSFTFFHCAISI